MMFDTELLKQAFTKVAEENFAKEIREWFIYTAPPSVNRMLGEYEKLLEEKNKE